MPKAVLFDVGDTLAHWHVSKAQRFGWLCARAGIALPDDPELCREAARVVELSFQRLRDHPDRWTNSWWLEHYGAGLAVLGQPIEQAQAVVDCRSEIERQSNANLWWVDPEARPNLAAMRSRGYRIGLVSNWDGTLERWCHDWELTGLVDALGDSQVVGWSKPSPEIFHHVLAGIGCAAQASFHVGDMYDFDVV